jgi:hypothetical protein
MFSLFLALSCEEKVGMGDKLSQADRDYLAQIGSRRCISESDRTFETFEETSNEKILAFVAGKAWRYEYKKDSTVVETSYIYVWKVDPPNVYFRVRLNNAGTVSNQFWKFDTSGNVDMIRNIQEKNCAKSLKVTVGTSAMTAVVETDRTREDSDTLVETSTDFRFSSSFPVYFADLNLMRKKSFYDNDGKFKKTETYDYTLTAISDVTQPSVYTDASIVNRSYCVPRYTTATGADTRDNYAFPFEENCGTSDVGTVDANADATPDFDPANEL